MEKTKKVSLVSMSFLDTFNWNKDGISWVYNVSQKLDEFVKSHPRESLFFDLQAEALLLTNFDPKSIDKKSMMIGQNSYLRI